MDIQDIPEEQFGPLDPIEQRPTDEIVRRARAFEDYYRIKNPQTLKRSAEYIWKQYCQRNRNGEHVPTTNRATIYKWKDQDDWEGKAAKRDLNEMNKDRKQFEAARERAYDALSMFGVEAVETMVEVMRTGDNKQRLEAAKTLLSRFGIPELSPKGAADSAAKDAKPKKQFAPPPADADEASLNDWLALVQPGGNHG